MTIKTEEETLFMWTHCSNTRLKRMHSILYIVYSIYYGQDINIFSTFFDHLNKKYCSLIFCLLISSSHTQVNVSEKFQSKREKV